MLYTARLLLAAALCHSLVADTASATLNVSSGASVVHLRQDCGSLPDCGDDMAELLTWLWNTRSPSASDRVTVEIGPGTFDPISCTNDGYVTFRGAGRANTVIESTTATPAVGVDTCTDLNFQDLTVKAYEAGFYWEDQSSGTLTNLDIRVGGSSDASFGWWDTVFGGGCSPRPQVYWWNVHVEVEATSGAGSALQANLPLYSLCADHWIYGSEFHVFGSSNTPADSGPLVGIYLAGGHVRMFGSAVRARVGGATGTTWHPLSVVAAFAGAWVGPGSAFHMHGGNINVDASASSNPVDVFGIDANRVFSNGAQLMVHTPGTSFIVKAGPGGTATRVRQNLTTVESPFQWPAGTAPPAITSVSGYDTFVETDCAANGNCSGGGTNTETHMMIYNSSCSTDGPWFNLATQKCRGVTVP